jgi:bifunctional oligoribonuclease and PAP phosphatase NrnA
MERILKHGALGQLADRIRSVSSIVLTTHSGPDGDGLGSLVAMRRTLEDRGVRTFCLLPDPLASRYRFLDPDGRLHPLAEAPPEELVRPWELALVLDTHQWEMLCGVGEWLKGSGIPTLFLDHHPSSEPARAEVFGDADAAATGELVYRLLREELGWPITPEAAESLYVAISFDTNSFKYIRGNPTSLRIAADLITLGADTNRVYRSLFASNPLGKARLLGWVLSSMAFECHGSLAYVLIPRQVVEEMRLDRDDLRDCITHLLEIEGVEVAATLKEVAEGEIKISLRSKGTFPIGTVAARMGGGGHALAAGYDVRGTLPEAWAALRAVLLEVCQGTDRPCEGPPRP